MGSITLTLPSGENQTFEIDGDEPTQEESLAINNYISSNRSVNERNLDDFFGLAGQGSSSGLSSAPEEYQDSFIGMSPNRDMYDKDVDYSSGIKNQGFRLAFSNLNNDRERELYLNKKLGPRGEFWDTDKGGRFILTTQGRQKLGNAGEGKIAIDEEGLSWSDVTDFIGEAGLPLAGAVLGTVAAIGLAPVSAPLLAASGLAGLGAGIGSLADEAQQAARGVADEDAKSVASRALTEAVLASAGEFVVGAGLNTARRLIKGAGGVGKTNKLGFAEDVFLGRATSDAGKKTAAELQALVDDGYKLDITGEGLADRPITGINVRLFETIMPGRLDENAQVLRRQIQEELFNGAEVVDANELAKVIKEFQAGELKLGEDITKAAQKEVEDVLTQAYDNILLKVGNEGLDPAQAAKDLSDIQRSFHKTMDDTYEAIDLDMGAANAKFLDIMKKGDRKKFNQALNKAGLNLDELNIQNVAKGGGPRGPRFIKPIEFKRFLKDHIDELKLDISKIEGDGSGIVKAILDEDEPLEALSLRQVNAVRTFVNSFDAERVLAGEASTFSLGKLRGALDNDIADSAARIRNARNSMAKKPTAPETKAIAEALDIMTKSIDDLDEAQVIYKNFMEHQDDASIRAMVRAVVNGDATALKQAQSLIEDPTQMAKFLSAVRKAKSALGQADSTIKINKDAGFDILNEAGEVTGRSVFSKGERSTIESIAQTVGKDGDTLVREVEEKIIAGQPVDVKERAIKNIIERKNTRVENAQAFSDSLEITLPELEDRSIEMFQKKFLQDAIEKSTDEKGLNIKKFGQIINKAKNKPKVAKGTKEGTAAGGFVDSAFENKSFFDMIFPEGQGDDLIETISELSRNIGKDNIDDISINLSEIAARKSTPNTGSRDIKDVIATLKDAKQFTDQTLGSLSGDVAEISAEESGSQALRKIMGASPGKKVQYFKDVDNYISKLDDGPTKQEAIKFRNDASDLVLADLIQNVGGGAGVDDVLDVLNPKKLAKLLDSEGKVAGLGEDEINLLFGNFKPTVIGGREVKTFSEALKRFGEIADLASSKAGGDKVRSVGLQAATAGTNVAGGFLGGNRRQAWNGLTKLARAFVLSRTIQSKPYMKFALKPPKSVQEMGKARLAIREVFIQNLNRAVRGGFNAGTDTVKAASQSLATPPETSEVEVEEKVTRRPTIDENAERFSVSAPRRTIPTPQQISLDGPAQQMSANVERDIALGAAGNNPTMQALLRARGQG